MNKIKLSPYADTKAAVFIDKRIGELKSKKSQMEIAGEAGFNNANALSMLKAGKFRVPLDRIPSLATALECDPARLFRLALEQHFEPSSLLAVRKIFGTILSQNEVDWIEAIRDASNNSDPNMTAGRLKILRALFGK